MSVWQGIDRAVFKNEVGILYRRGRFQEQSGLPPLPPPVHRPSNDLENEALALDFPTESQLADDFAFLANTTSWPGDVTAATVQQKASPDRLRVTLAANAGVKEDVQLFFKDLLTILEQRAAHSLKKDIALDSFLGEIARIHKDRIFGRMSLQKAEGQKKREPNVVEKLDSMIKELQRRVKQHGGCSKSASMFEQFQKFRSFLSIAESAPSGSDEEYTAIKDLLRASSGLTIGSLSLARRLQLAGFTNISDRSRVVRELQALGNYYRISKYAISTSWRYKRWFKTIELNVVETDPNLGACARETFFVHAEIQLLIHFELDPKNSPRYIGASKKPCFLCYCFIRGFRKHQVYSIGRSHGEVFEHWTVPDSDEFNKNIRRRLNSALKSTLVDVRNAKRLPTSPSPSKWCFHPLQSVSKLKVEALRDLSRSTVETRRTILAEITPSAPISATVSLEHKNHESDRPLASLEESALLLEAIHSDSPGAEETAFAHGFESNFTDQSVIYERKVTAESPREFRSGVLELFFEFEDPHGVDVESSTTVAKTGVGLCRVRPISRILEKEIQAIDISKIDHEHIILTSEEASRKLEFVIKAGKSAYAIELRWL